MNEELHQIDLEYRDQLKAENAELKERLERERDAHSMTCAVSDDLRDKLVEAEANGQSAVLSQIALQEELRIQIIQLKSKADTLREVVVDAMEYIPKTNASGYYNTTRVKAEKALKETNE